jgi:hypothetical protein
MSVSYQSLVLRMQKVLCTSRNRRPSEETPTNLPVQWDLNLQRPLSPIGVWAVPTLPFSRRLLLRCLRRKNPTSSEPVAARLPVEVWLLILGTAVLDNNDINAVVKTNKFFFDIASHLLYRDIVWINAAHVSVSLPIWNGAADFLSSKPRSLVFGLTEVPEQPAVSVFGPDGLATQVLTHKLSGPVEESLVLNGGDTVALTSSPLFTKILSVASSFSLLETLVFRCTIVTPHWYRVVGALNKLHTLRFERCIIPGAIGAPVDANPSISELSLLNIKQRLLYIEGADFPAAFTPNRLRNLLLSPTLTTLHIDPESLSSFNLTEEEMPQGLRHFYVHNDRRGVVTSPRRDVEYVVGRIIASCNLLESFSNTSPLYEFLPAEVSVDSLKQFGLERYRGRWWFLQRYRENLARSLRLLHLIDIENTPSHIGWLDRHFPRLNTLAFDIPRWESKILLLHRNQLKLRRLVCLQIRYGGDALDAVGFYSSLRT